MVRVSSKKMGQKILEEISDRLLTRVIRANTAEHAAKLLNELLGDEERIVLAKRLSIVALLEHGLGPRSVAQILKVSTSTVMRVARDIEGGRYGALIQVFRKEKGSVSTGAFLKNLVDFFEANLSLSNRQRSQLINRLMRENEKRRALVKRSD